MHENCTVIYNCPSNEIGNYDALYLFIWKIMDIITVNGHEISLGCFVNLHAKTACVYNVIFAKISNYYDTITHWSVAINAF